MIAAIIDGAAVKVHRQGADEVQVYALSTLSADLEAISQGLPPVNISLDLYKAWGADLCNEILDEARKRKKAVRNNVPTIAEEFTSGWLVDCPVTKEKGRLFEIIIRLNDNHKWSREKIADWLDSLPDQPKWKLMDNVTDPKPKINF